MAKITTTIDLDKDLTTFSVEGDLSASEIIDYSSEYYDKNPTKLVLWDARMGSVGKIATEDFVTISKFMKIYTQKRSGGKTAIVGQFDVDFARARQYKNYAEIEELPVEYKVFHTLEEAKEWLHV